MADIWCAGRRPGAEIFTTFRSGGQTCHEAGKGLGLERIHPAPMAPPRTSQLNLESLPVAADPQLGSRLDAVG